mgnify:CR=1 FL=1
MSYLFRRQRIRILTRTSLGIPDLFDFGFQVKGSMINWWEYSPDIFLDGIPLILLIDW